ncbi:hypothetical protein NMY22_g14727 [Coprinellus aureogranulatus]|nr:hypothetical protein NMY22_g14727 [Coprinellus aureogranulatus]
MAKQIIGMQMADLLLDSSLPQETPCGIRDFEAPQTFQAQCGLGDWQQHMVSVEQGKTWNLTGTRSVDDDGKVRDPAESEPPTRAGNRSFAEQPPGHCAGFTSPFTTTTMSGSQRPYLVLQPSISTTKYGLSSSLETSLTYTFQSCNDHNHYDHLRAHSLATSSSAYLTQGSQALPALECIAATLVEALPLRIPKWDTRHISRRRDRRRGGRG